MKKITIIGKYIFKDEVVGDGQSIKTRIITQEIKNHLPDWEVGSIDTYGWKKNSLGLIKDTFLAVRRSEHVIFMTDEGGIKVFPWLLRLSNLFGKCALHYVVVGGWLPRFLEQNPFYCWCLKPFKGIYVESTTMKKRMDAMGFENVCMMPNFKSLTLLAEEELVYSEEAPYRLCTFSRVMREKGIGEAVKAVKAVNSQWGKIVCTLDIYGQVEPEQADWFRDLQQEFTPEIRYMGTAPFDQSVEILKGYFALLFPTYYSSEGFAGTVIDAFSAGVPLVATDWLYNPELIREGENGTLIPPQDANALTQKLVEICRDVAGWNGQKVTCLEHARRYRPEIAIKPLLERLN